MSYTKSFRTILEGRNSILYARLMEIQKIVEPLLNYTSSGFPYYTPHGFSHSKQVEENLNWIVPDEIKPTLNDWEIFFMIVAAWTHDWGMVCQPGENPEEVRKTHHVRTEQNFEKLYSLLKLDSHEAIIIGRIGRGHRKEDLRGYLFDEIIHSSNIHVDRRFLAALVRIADECDITYNRVPELIYYSLNPQGASEEHFKNHIQIGGCGNDGPYKISFNAIAKDPKGAETLRTLQAKIQKELDHVQIILARKNIPLEFVDARIDCRGFIDKPITFRLDEGRITNLLIGEELYSRSDVAIRELLQNAVDACRVRNGLNPKPPVAIRIYQDDGKIIIEDNGIGMDYDTAFNFLSNKGFSYYTSDELKKIVEKMDFDPISRWGIGILSCFLIASKILIETKQEGKPSCKFIIGKVEEGWRYEEGLQKNSGTIITLILNEEGQKIDLAKSITHYVKSAAVPIFIGKESTEPLKFDWNSEDSTITIEFKKYYKTERSISIDFVRDYEDDDIWIRWYESMPFGRKVFISNQGFYVGKFEEKIICPHNSILLVNVKKNILDLNVSRDRIRVGTPKFDDFEKKWIKIMYKILKKELEDELKKTNGNIVDEYLLKFQLVRDYGLMEPIYYYHSESIIHYTELPLHIQEFFQTQISHLVITSDGFKLVSFNELVSMSPQSVKVFQLPMSDDVDNRAEIFAVESHIKKQLKPNEILIFLFEPPWDYEWDKFTEYFKLKLGKDISFSELTLPELCGNLSVAETTLDVLLPKNSNFASLSEMFRSSVICSSKYSIQLLITSRMEEIPYFILGFSVSEKFQKQVTDGKFAVKKEGKIVFDLEDQFIKLLFKNEKTILNSPILVDMLKSYFGLLALVYFSNVYFTYDLLEQKERELLQSLNISEKIPPLIKRQGQISKGLKSVRLLHALGSRNSLITVTGESSLQF